MDFLDKSNFTNYSSFQKATTEEQQDQIRALVDFFNDLSHMMRGEYIDDIYPMRIYQPALFTCYNKLLPWWLEGMRADSYPLLYQNFNWLCKYAVFLEEEKAKTKHKEIPKASYLSFIKSLDN